MTDTNGGAKAREDPYGSTMPSTDATGDFPQMPDSERVASIRRMRDDLARFMMEYEFAVDEILTKVTILRREFLHLHKYNPIEHVNSRVKNPGSILEKASLRGCEPTLAAIREEITDIAGIRIICSFIADTYRILEALVSQDDIQVLEIKDYIKNPKANGYKSLHAIVEIPVFLSTGAVPVIVEIQIRTIAMDFWASLEHKIFYKYKGTVPDHLASDLSDAAEVAEQLDRRMEQLHTEVRGRTDDLDEDDTAASRIDDAMIRRLWEFSHPDIENP